jgi:hypothetical protein
MLEAFQTASNLRKRGGKILLALLRIETTTKSVTVIARRRHVQEGFKVKQKTLKEEAKEQESRRARSRSTHRQDGYACCVVERKKWLQSAGEGPYIDLQSAQSLIREHPR